MAKIQMCDFLHKMLSKIELESDEKSSATVKNVHVFPLKHLLTAGLFKMLLYI